MTNDFLIGAIRDSRDLHPQVKTELEEILHRRNRQRITGITEQEAMKALMDAGWTECDYNCVPFAMVKRKIGRIEEER